MSYFVIHPSEDGISVEELDRATLEVRLTEGYYGEGDRAPQWVESMPEHSDPNYWRGKSVIVKGVIVVPAAEQVVTKVRLP